MKSQIIFRIAAILAISGLSWSCSDDAPKKNGDSNDPINQTDCSSIIPGTVLCDGSCINPMTFNAFCGADEHCENYKVCTGNQICVNGECYAPTTPDNCNPGLIKCGNDCIDPLNDMAYCGADESCTNYTTCVDGQICLDGYCQGDVPLDDCEPGFVKCANACIDPLNDMTYCGADEACLNYIPCVDGQTCLDGHCQSNEPQVDCDPGLVKCGDDCIDPLNDMAYCGADESCTGYTECTGILECKEGRCLDLTPLVLTIQSESTEIKEDGAMELQLSLNHAPENDIEIALTVDEATGVLQSDKISIEPATITLTPSNWESHSLFIHSERDYKKTGDKTLKVHANATSDNSISTQMDVLYKDIDICKLSFNPNEIHITSENETTSTVEVSLTCIPDNDVIYTLLSDNAAEGILQEPADKRMTFTSETWNIPQTLTVKGIDDENADGPQNYHIILTPDSSNSEDFQNGYSLDFVNHDNDVPAINAMDNITVTEGGTGTLEISLATKPEANVNITVGDIPEGLELINSESLTFTPDNYKVPQQIAIHTIDNNSIDGSRVSNLHLSASSTDSNYQNLSLDIQVTVEDNDTADIAFKPNGANFNTERTYKENDHVISYFNLTSKPESNVTVNVSLSDNILIYGSGPTEFTFTPENWNESQTLEFYIKRDGIVNSSPIKGTITFTGSSSDPNYNVVLKKGDLNIINIDAYTMQVGDTDPEGYTYPGSIAEDDPHLYDMCFKLQAKPTSSVTVTATSSNTSKLKLNKSSVTIDPSEGLYWRCIPFGAVDNYIKDGNQTAYVSFKLSSSDSHFNGLQFKSQNITIIDNDETPVIIVTEASTPALDCTSSTANSKEYKVRLANPPAADITVTAALEEYKSFSGLEYTKHAGITISPTTALKFTKSNYATERTVTVSCTKNGKALYNTLVTNVRFHTSSEYYPANDVVKSFTSYPVGRTMRWNYTGSQTSAVYLPRGEYKIDLCGAQGGGNDDHGGYGGKVSTNIMIGTTIVAQPEFYISVGGKGKRGPTSSSDTNNSGGWGIASGGNGDWGTSNWSYGGGGATGIRMTKDKLYMIVAGGGGGGTAKWKDASGWGGKGGCEGATDSNCFGRDEDAKYYSKGTHEYNQGESSTKGDEEGGGGGGIRGGLAGSRSQVGGNGGTSGISTTSTNVFTVKSKSIVPGICGNDGYVNIEVVPTSY